MVDECPQGENELTCLRQQNAELKKEAAESPGACETGAALGGMVGMTGFLFGPTGFLTTPAGAAVGCVVGMGYESARNKILSSVADFTDDMGEGFCRTAPDFPNAPIHLCPDKSPKR